VDIPTGANPIAALASSRFSFDLLAFLPIAREAHFPAVREI
jgi:hypothetical protein